MNETREEIKSGLQVSQPFNYQLYQKELMNLLSGSSVDFKFGNRVFVHEDVQVQPSYSKKLSNYFKSDIEEFSLADGADVINR